MYEPQVQHDGKSLRCTYEQKDQDGNLLFEGNSDDMDDITLSVHFLEKPEFDITLPTAIADEDYTIRIEFSARPKPHFDDLSWVLESGGNEEEVRFWFRSHFIAPYNIIFV